VKKKATTAKRKIQNKLAQIVHRQTTVETVQLLVRLGQEFK